MLTADRATIARFTRQIAKQASGCWLWTGSDQADGYGRWRPHPGSKVYYLHVWAYLVYRGDIPDGMQVDHRCHSDDPDCPGGQDCKHRRCCNPAHLELVTASENTTRQRHFNRLKDHCPQGHPLSGDNLVIWESDGRRRCRICLRNRQAPHEA